jgi:hypothetical protein
MHPGFIDRGFMPIIMEGIVGIDGLVTAVIIAPGVKDTEYSLFSG